MSRACKPAEVLALDAVFLFETAEGAAIFAGFEGGMRDIAAVFVKELFDVALFESFDRAAATFAKVFLRRIREFCRRFD